MLAFPSFLVLALLPTLHATTAVIELEDRLLPRQPVPRSYDTHSYYSIELHPAAAGSASDAAAHLGLELVEPLGELAHHYLARLAHDDHTRRGGEAGLKRSWRALRKRSAEVEAVRGLELMRLRKRTKREWVEPMHDRFALRGESTFGVRQEAGDGMPAANMAEFDFMVGPACQTDLCSPATAADLLTSSIRASTTRASLSVAVDAQYRRPAAHQAVAPGQHRDARERDERLETLGAGHHRRRCPRRSHRRRA